MNWIGKHLRNYGPTPERVHSTERIITTPFEPSNRLISIGSLRRNIAANLAIMIEILYKPDILVQQVLNTQP